MMQHNLFYQGVQFLTGKKLDLDITDQIINIPPCFGPLFGGKEEKLSVSIKEAATTIHDILYRKEEHLHSNHDKWDRFDHDQSALVISGLDHSPIVDELVFCIIKQLKLTVRNIWPKGKRAAVCLTHDVDQFDGRSYLILRKMWWFYRAILSLTLRRKEICKEYLAKIRRWTDSEYDPVYAFNKWMALEDKYGFRSTFFFFGLKHALSREGRLYSFRNRRVRETIRRLDKNGWEIGLHAGYHRNLELESLSGQKKNLEDALNKKILGCRHHFLRVRFPKSWQLYEDAGFAYSSNMAWGGEYQGFRAGTSIPYKPIAGRALIEIPFQLMDMACIENPVEYHQLFLNYLKKVKKVNGCLVIDFHQQYFDEVESPGTNRAYRMILESLAEDKEIWVTPLIDVHSHFCSKYEDNGGDLTKGALR